MIINTLAPEGLWARGGPYPTPGSWKEGPVPPQAGVELLGLVGQVQTPAAVWSEVVQTLPGATEVKRK